MAFKFVILAVLVAAANAGLLGAPLATTYAAAPVAYSAPIAKAVVSEEYDPNPQYSYGYDVQDALTGDNKNQYESRNGDVVQGSYSLNDPDGTRRTVEYTADPINGFNAIVHKEPLVAAPAVAKVAAPLAYHAPIAKVAAPIAYPAPVARIAAPLAYPAPVARIATPLAYHAPVARIAYGAPIAKYAAPLAYSTNLIH